MAYRELFKAGVFLFDQFTDDGKIVSRVTPPEHCHYGTEKPPEFTGDLTFGGDTFIKFDSLTTIEKIMNLPPALQELFLPILLNGGTIWVHRDGGRLDPWKPHKWGNFWFKVVYFAIG